MVAAASARRGRVLTGEAPCPERARHLPGGDSRWDDEDGQQPGLVQRLGHVGEHVDEAPARSGGSGGSAEMTLPALGAQGGVARQCRHVRARVGGRPPTPTGYAGSHSTPTCPRRRTAGAAPPTRPCAKGAQPGSPRSQPRLPSLCNDRGPGRCWRQSSVCLRYRWGAGTGCPILGHMEGEPGVSTGRAPPHEPRRWGVSTGHRAGDKGGGVTGSPGPSRGQVAACPARRRPAWLLPRPGNPSGHPSPAGSAWPCGGWHREPRPRTQPRCARPAFWTAHVLCVHSDLAPMSLCDQPSVLPCSPSGKQW